MFDRLKAKLRQKKTANRLKKHMADAEGSTIQRGAVAIVMVTLEDDVVQEQKMELTVHEQQVFLMTYGCMVLWYLLRGFASGGMTEHEQANVVMAVKRHLEKESWYASDLFERLWKQTQIWMPQLGVPAEDGKFFPLAALVQIVSASGCQGGCVTSYSFGVHIIYKIPAWVEFGKATAKLEDGHPASS